MNIPLNICSPFNHLKSDFVIECQVHVIMYTAQAAKKASDKTGGWRSAKQIDGTLQACWVDKSASDQDLEEVPDRRLATGTPPQVSQDKFQTGGFGTGFIIDIEVDDDSLPDVALGDLLLNDSCSYLWDWSECTGRAFGERVASEIREDVRVESGPFDSSMARCVARVRVEVNDVTEYLFLHIEGGIECRGVVELGLYRQGTW